MILNELNRLHGLEFPINISEDFVTLQEELSTSNQSEDIYQFFALYYRIREQLFHVYYSQLTSHLTEVHKVTSHCEFYYGKIEDLVNECEEQLEQLSLNNTAEVLIAKL